MLKISEEQITALQGVVDGAFEERLFSMARRHMDPWVGEVPDPALRRRIHEDCEAGRGLGLGSFRALTMLVGLSLFRPDMKFSEHPFFEDHLRRSPDPEWAIEEMFAEVEALLLRDWV